MIRRFCIVAVGVASALMIFANVSISAALEPSPSVIARGRALVVFGTCNDCHTPGWRDADGSIAVGRWMTGSSIGFRGWWGTSYPTNVRLDFQEMTEERWLLAARTRAGHPPMIWQDIRGLPDADIRAIYQFIKSLGRTGVPAPAAIPPWREPTTSFIDMRSQPAPGPKR